MTVAAELHGASLARTRARIVAEETRTRALAEGLITPDPIDLEHERAQSYRRGRADALAMVARWLDVEIVEIGRAERALVEVPR